MSIKSKKYLFSIVGLGSIGKAHAKNVSGLASELVLVDPSEDARAWAENYFEGKAKIYESLDSASEYIARSKSHKIGIVSTWGTLHQETFQSLFEMGFKKFFIEKPLSNSLKSLDEIKELVIKHELRLVAGFQSRYAGLSEYIKKVSSQELGGPPSLIAMSGGAFGMVTNGIHYLDLAISIFNDYPDSVFSDLNSSNINPRSKELDFWEGSSTWSFSQNRSVTISATNLSSVRQVVEIYCPRGRIRINEDMTLSVFKRDPKEVEQDNRIIRLGKAVQDDGLGFSPDYKDYHLKMLSPLMDNGVQPPAIEREIIATKSIIYSLISSRLQRKLSMNHQPADDLYSFPWKIS